MQGAVTSAMERRLTQALRGGGSLGSGLSGFRGFGVLGLGLSGFRGLGVLGLGL